MKRSLIRLPTVRCGFVSGRPQIERAALPQRDFDKPGLDQQVAQCPRGKAGAMRHEPVAARQRRGMSKDHVERRDWTAQGGVGLVFEPVFDDELRHLPQIGQCRQQQALRLQHPDKLRERQRNFVTLQVLEIVRRPDRVDRFAFDRAHIGDRANDVGLDSRVEVEPDLLPLISVKMRVQFLP